MTDAKPFKNRLLAWLRGNGGEESFEEISLEVFAFQFSANPAYRKYCEALGRTPANVAHWRDIPALPTDAFKFSGFSPRSFPAENTTRYFLTSGTTAEIRGRHEFEDLELYETSIIEGWRKLELPEISNPWFLSQAPSDAPLSSLVHMFDVLRREAGVGNERWLIDAGGRFGRIDVSSPIAVFSTAIALKKWMESGQAEALPEGSWVFETGGYKGLNETWEPAVFRHRLANACGIPEERILNEYSMTELSSQFYKWPTDDAHRGPFWTRVRVINPETGSEAAEGQAGYLEIIDLANLGSVAAIRTQDLAIAKSESTFVLLGRDPMALPRGCSRAADDLLQRA